MIRSTITLACLALLAAPSVFAISPSDDLLIAGAVRSSTWTSDLHINNPGATDVSVDVIWLYRNPLLSNPAPETFSVGPDETLILDDVILNTFGISEGEGAFRITAAGGEVTANLVAFAGAGSEDGTYGAGFEGIPASAATSAGQSTNLAGLVLTNSFYSNLFALAGASGVTMDVDLLDPDGDVLDSEQVVLGAYNPWFSSAANLWDVPSFENGTAQARVSAGSMVMLGSKIDRISRDPATLEQAFGGGGSVDGTYQFAVYDNLAFASGGNLVIDDAVVETINGTYVNFDKVDGGGSSECTLIFLWGIGLAPTPVGDFASGVEFTDSYPDGGDMAWIVTFTVDNNLGFAGTVDAVGSNFTGVDAGCNGTFPPQLFEGGKSN